jgi:hypothetical protein
MVITPTITCPRIRLFKHALSADEQRLKAVFGHRLGIDDRTALGQAELFGGALADTVWAWMSGETLSALNVRCGGNPANPGTCSKARKFVRLVPDLAFAAGLATRVRRKQLEEAGDERMPLTLAALALCVREGAAEPEIAALRLHSAGHPTSRHGLRELWSEIRVFAPPRDEYESFGRTRTRVETALTRHRVEQV